MSPTNSPIQSFSTSLTQKLAPRRQLVTVVVSAGSPVCITFKTQ